MSAKSEIEAGLQAIYDCDAALNDFYELVSNPRIKQRDLDRYNVLVQVLIAKISIATTNIQYNIQALRGSQSTKPVPTPQELYQQALAQGRAQQQRYEDGEEPRQQQRRRDEPQGRRYA